MSTFDNQPPLEGWKVQPGRHCGEICVDAVCPFCGEYTGIPWERHALGQLTSRGRGDGANRSIPRHKQPLVDV